MYMWICDLSAMGFVYTHMYTYVCAYVYMYWDRPGSIYDIMLPFFVMMLC